MSDTEATKADRLAEIKARFPPGTISDQSWLIHEVERLRDALRAAIELNGLDWLKEVAPARRAAVVETETGEKHG